MSNNMYLKFESNQVLSETHLNVTVSYLEEQIRRTRNSLLGAGIVSGFEVERPTTTSIKIFIGTAITSEGYLAQLESENFIGTGDKKNLIYDKIKTYEPKNLAFPYLGEADESTIVYPQFDGIVAGDIKLLLPNSDPKDDSNAFIVEGDLTNKVVVLFLECTAKELKNCEADNCYDYGKELIFKLQPLLMSRDSAVKLINAELQTSALSENTLKDKLLSRFKLTTLPLAKPRFNTITDTYTVNAWADLFKTKLSALKAELSIKNTSIDSAISTILDSTATPLSAFTTKLNTYLTNVASVPANNLGAWQYIYDFAVDFITAYEELVEALLDFLSYRIKSNLAFPMHIRLGIVPTLGNTTKIYNPADELFRHTYYSSQNVNEQQQAHHTATILLNRLSKIVEKFNASNLLQFGVVRITPDSGSTVALSKRSIPFYYGQPGQNTSPEIKSLWNAEYSRWNRQNRVLNYSENSNAVTYSDTGSANDSFDENTLLPLVYRQRDADFYRIEGILGLQYGTAYSAILNYRNNYGLPFELVMLKLNKTVSLPILNQEVYFMDLESLYNVLKVEITCLLGKSKTYFSSIKIDSSSSITANFSNITIAAEASKVSVSEAAPKASTAKVSNIEAKSESVGTQSLFGGTEVMASAQMSNELEYNFLQNSIGYYVGNQTFLPGILQSFLNPTQSNAISVLNAIDGVSKAITETFKDFDPAVYKTKVDTLLAAALTYINYAKGHSDAFFIQQKLVKKGELLDFLDRIYYECDWKKLEAVGKEKANRMNYIFKQNLLSEFIKYNPGVDHMAGVPKGGTFLLIFDEKGTVVGDLAIPYILNSSLPPIQYVLGVIQSIVITGQVKNAQGLGQPTAQFSIDNVPVALDSQGRYAKTVAANQSYVLKAVLAGFTTNQQIINVAENDVIQDIILIAVNDQPKTKVKITIKNAAGAALAGASIAFDNKTFTTDATGVVTIDVNTNTDYPYTVSLNGYYSQNLVANVKSVQLDVPIALHTKVLAQITVLDEAQKPFIDATVTIDGAVVIDQKDNVYSQEVDGDVTHTLKVVASGYGTYSETLNLGGKPFTKTIQLVKVTTQAVNVGVYTSERSVDGSNVITYLTNLDVAVTVDKRELSYVNTSTFFSGDFNGPKTFALRVEAVSSGRVLDAKSIFDGNLGVEDKDLIVLIGVKTVVDGIYSIQIPIDKEKQTAALVNKLLIQLLKFKSKTAVVRGDIDIRLYSEAEFQGLSRQLSSNNIIFTSRILG